MSGKILIIDDEPDLETLLRQKFRQKIRQNHLQLIFAGNGSEALEKLKTYPDIDVVLADIYRPEIDGLTLLTQLRELHPLIEVVIISACNELEHIRTAMNCGAFDFLTKPINFDDLEITLQKTLQHVQYMKTALEKIQLAQQSQAQLLTHLQQEVAKRQQVEESLRASERQMTQFLEAVPVGVFVVDAQGKAYYANQKAQQILGKGLVADATAEQLAETYHIYRVGTDEIYPSLEQPIVKALQGENVTIDDMEIRQEERIIPLEVSATPVFDDRGHLAYAIATFRDITQRKLAEAERIKIAQVEALLQQDRQELEILANYDGLTQVANRRCFDSYLNQEWNRLTREQVPLGLILCDVDFFKVYNDLYGHQAGDLCLQKVAATLQESIKRPADLVARYGGEEFAIILPNTNIQGSVEVAEAMKSNLRALQIVHEGSQTERYITLSFGVASIIPIAHQSSSILLTAADSALYQAKKLGRNRIICSVS
jgi:diguanylate cyclase (GGDEF)-like protein/PAS domain S-box-containing protein